MQKLPLKSVIFIQKVPFILHIAVAHDDDAKSNDAQAIYRACGVRTHVIMRVCGEPSGLKFPPCMPPRTTPSGDQYSLGSLLSGSAIKCALSLWQK